MPAAVDTPVQAPSTTLSGAGGDGAQMRRTGWLWKRSKHLQQFNGRWVEAHGGSLLYWATRSAAHDAQSPRGVISLDGALVSPSLRIGSHPWCICIVPSGAKAPLVFACATEAERRSWLETMLLSSMILSSRPHKVMPVCARPQSTSMSAAPAAAAAAVGAGGGRQACALRALSEGHPAASATPRPDGASSESSVSPTPSERTAKAVFFVGRGGGGHLASAVAVRDCLLNAAAATGSIHEQLSELSLGAEACATLPDSAFGCPSSIEIIDIGKLVEDCLFGEWAKMIPFSGDDVYNWCMKNGQYSMANVCTHLGMTSVANNANKLRAYFGDWLRTHAPSVVLCFVPGLNFVLRGALQDALPGVELLTVITDMETNNAHRWIDPFSEDPASGCTRHTVVAGGARLQQQAVEAGYPPEHVLRTDGMVVHPGFYAQQRAPEAEGAEGSAPAAAAAAAPAADASASATSPAAPSACAERQSVLIFFGGYAPPRTYTIAAKLLERFGESVELVVLCGKNSALQAKLQARVDAAHKPGAPSADAVWAHTLVEGFIPPSRLVHHLRTASCVIGKPGPGAASEAAVMRVPFVTEVTPQTMPQELCVADWLLETNYGIIVKELTDMPADLLSRLDECKRALAAHQNRAVFQVAARVRALTYNAFGGLAEPDE